jgi:DNA-binding NarL/FixJ family response regulator
MSDIRVLLADDHAIVRAGIRRMIDEIPGLIVVDEVGNGPQVFEVLARESVDCLLIDLTMPDFDPISAIQRIHSLYPELKILVVSAYDDDIYVQGMLAAGVNGYHLKDQPLNDLQLAIRRVLDGERWLSSPLISKLVGKTSGSDAIPSLTNRQRDLLRLLKQGFDNNAIAKSMGLSIKTVENHLTRLYRQLNVQSRLEAVNYISRYPHVLGASGQEAALNEAPPRSNIQSWVSILVVDDNARYRTQLQRMIGRLYPQATIYEAESIQEAVDLVQRVKIRLALIDVVLGDADGLSCTRRIKAILPQCRIILISAYPDREFHRQGLQSGAVAFLDKKDLDLPTLRHLIDDVL